MLKERALLSDAQRNITTFVRQIKTFKPMENIDSFKTLVRNVIIEQDGRIRININLIKDNFIQAMILESSVELRVGNGKKTI
ncbi:MAG TPA: hypothetical protein PKC96_05710 [Bacilli bacterium]|nr:hypothetical protein [Bacilli bacterium]